jgi:hypothetical protein
VIPGMNAVGMKTADRMMAMAMMTGDETTSSIALNDASLGGHALLDVMLDRLDDDDGVVDHEPVRPICVAARQAPASSII